MGDTWTTNMTHFLDTQGQPAVFGGSQRIAKHFGAIVSDLTTSPPATIREVPPSPAAAGQIEEPVPAKFTPVLSPAQPTSSGRARYATIAGLSIIGRTPLGIKVAA